MRRPLVYLAGPMKGLTVDNANEWRTVTKNFCYDHNIETVSPLRGRSSLVDKEVMRTHYDGDPLLTQSAITRRDYFDVRRSDAVFVNFMDSKTVSIGTIAEIAWAWQLQKPVIVIMEKDSEFDPDLYKLLNTHPFMCEFVTIRVYTLEDGLQSLLDVVRTGD